jgi:hypothetical protein
VTKYNVLFVKHGHLVMEGDSLDEVWGESYASWISTDIAAGGWEAIQVDEIRD